MGRSIIFLTTQTSATASMWRIFSIIRNTEQPYWWTADFWKEGRQEELKETAPPAEDHFIMMNWPEYLNRNIDFTKYRWILNMRDPRDILCNQFYWTQQHEEPNRQGTALENHSREIARAGIDAFVLQKKRADYLRSFQLVTEKANPDDVCVLTYALLCLDFDRFVAKAKHFFGAEFNDDQLRRLDGERNENLSQNQDWIGTKWVGSDVMPGRYKRELKPETIAKLNGAYGDVLQFLRSIEEPTIRHVYDA